MVPRDVLKILDQLFPFAAEQVAAGSPREQTLDLGQASAVAALVGVLDRIPRELVALEGEDLAGFYVSTEVLRNALAMWHGPRQHNVTTVRGFGALNPVSLIRKAIEKCPNELIPASTADFPFLRSDPDLREALRVDLARAEKDALGGDPKGSTVLAGSVLEALLLWALSHPNYKAQATSCSKAPRRNGSVKPLEKWDLGNYIDVAAEVGLLFTDDTITEAGLARNYRNLIHPGRVQRFSQRCDRDTARVALAAVGHVALDLTARFP